VPRPGYRVRLESGFRLNINQLAKVGGIPPVGSISLLSKSWSDSYTAETSATAMLRIERQTDRWGSCTISMNGRQQRVSIQGSPRHYGGLQWYFICPVMNRVISILWMPPGASTFACRERWGSQVAYASQFCGRDDRAHRGQAKIKGKLCRLGGFDPEEWAFPPRPKGMRWRTYRLFEEKFDAYERQLDEGTAALLLRLEVLK
jgi:hypothetical protein